jgi:hypothetical protein
MQRRNTPITGRIQRRKGGGRARKTEQKRKTIEKKQSETGGRETTE